MNDTANDNAAKDTPTSTAEAAGDNQQVPPQPTASEAPLPMSDGPGQQLKARREAAGLSEMETASRLSISIHQLRALEADDYQNLPAPIFVRNYLTRYANLFGLAPEPLLDAYQRVADQLQPGLNRVSQREKINSRHVSVRWASYTVGALVVGLLLVWFINIGIDKFRSAGESTEASTDQHDTLTLPRPTGGSETPR